MQILLSVTWLICCGNPRLYNGGNGLKHLLVGSPFQLVKSLGKGGGGTKMFVQLKPVPDMLSQLAPKTRMGDFFCANAASTKHPRLVLMMV